LMLGDDEKIDGYTFGGTPPRFEVLMRLPVPPLLPEVAEPVGARIDCPTTVPPNDFPPSEVVLITVAVPPPAVPLNDQADEPPVVVVAPDSGAVPPPPPPIVPVAPGNAKLFA